VVTPCTEVGFFGHSNFRSSKPHTAVPSLSCMLSPLSSLGLIGPVMLSHCMFSPASGPIFVRVVASRPFQAHLGCPCHPICNHMRGSQCAVCWCSPYQGFPSMIHAHSRGMAVCGVCRGAVHEHRQRTTTYSYTPTDHFSFHCNRWFASRHLTVGSSGVSSFRRADFACIKVGQVQ